MMHNKTLFDTVTPKVFQYILMTAEGTVGALTCVLLSFFRSLKKVLEVFIVVLQHSIMGKIHKQEKGRKKQK
jgi:hypothetical protein